MKLHITQSGIVLPSSQAAKYVTVTILQNGEPFDQIVTRLCPKEEADGLFYLDMTSLRDTEVEISVSDHPASTPAKPEVQERSFPYTLLEQQITCSEPLPDSDAVKAMRPKLHFTTRTGWLNDPNGTCWYDGLYHLCYQYIPGATRDVWRLGNMHWGHAVSRDLVHWQECEPAVRLSNATSGSAFVRRETGNLCLAWKNVIAESSDGVSFTRNAELERKKGLDPQIFYHEESGNYVAVDLCYNDEKKRYEDFQISVSPDLQSWEITDRMVGWFECPNLTKLPIEGTDACKWVLFGGDLAYQIGEFDGKKFIPDEMDPQRKDPYRGVSERGRESQYTNKYNGQWTGGQWNPDAYAFQVFGNIPNGRVLRCGWFLIHYANHGMPFNQCITLTHELSLRHTVYGLRLCAEPVRELEQLRGKETLLQASGSFACESGDTWELLAELHSGASLTVNEHTFTYAEAQLTVSHASQPPVVIPFPAPEKPLRLRGITDIGSLEVFADEGELYIPLCLKQLSAGLSVTLAGNEQDRVCIFPLEV